MNTVAVGIYILYIFTNNGVRTQEHTSRASCNNAMTVIAQSQSQNHDLGIIRQFCLPK